MAARVEVSHALSAKQRQGLEATVARIGQVVEAESTLSLGAVDARPHL